MADIGKNARHLSAVWDADGPEIEALIKAVEEDGLSYSMAMGELLAALYGLSQTLSGHQADAALKEADKREQDAHEGKPAEAG